jgi:cytochrome c-type biogenesis protein CcmF
MISDLGHLFIFMSVALSGYAVVGSGFGAKLAIQQLVDSARLAGYLASAMLILATSALIAAFVTQDFGIQYVAENSSTSMEPWLTWVAFYAGNEGSLLFLATIFSVLAALAILGTPTELADARPYTTAVLLGVVLFFSLVMSTLANPFTELSPVPLDGRGINPLLTHPGMLVHPPMLMTGLIGVAIPFAFAIGHLLSGQIGDEWVETARRWALVVWAILTTGLLLGSWWAYTILGWGGYWAWDPVENAGLLPWLPLTAFIHSIMIQRRRGMFRSWNILLIIIAWGMAMYGMFMNRGGPIPSVHSFAQSSLGWVFLLFLIGSLLFAFAVFFWRYGTLRNSLPLVSPLSREAAFLLNNFLFLIIAFVTLWGVVYPLISDVFQGVAVTVGRPYYDVVLGPLFLALVVLMGVGPLIPWRRTTSRLLINRMAMPMVVGFSVAVLAAVLGVRSLFPLLGVVACTVALAGIAREWVLGTRIRVRRGENYITAFVRLIMNNRPRYGGYIVHLGIVLLGFSVVGSSFYGTQKDVTMVPGEEVIVQGFTLQYISNSTEEKPDGIKQTALLRAKKGEKVLGLMTPGYRFYPDFSMAATRAAIRSTPREDLYVIANEFSENGQAVFRIYVNPLVFWMWIAGPLFVMGTLIALWPERSRTRPRA